MTGPVLTDDLVAGAVKMLAAQPDVLAVLGAYPATAVPYLFQHTLWDKVEGTGSTAAVIARRGGWAPPNPHNTMRFPRLSLEVWCDPQRDTSGQVTDPGEAYRRIQAAYEVIDAHLHTTGPRGGNWGGVRVLGSSRLADPAAFPIADGDGLLWLQVFYGVVEG